MAATRATLGHLPWREWKREHRQGFFWAVTGAVVVTCAVAFAALMGQTPRSPSLGVMAQAMMQPPHPDDVSYAQQQVGTMLEDQRVLLSEICWQRDLSDPSSAWAATVRVVFDAQGRQIERDIVENRGSARPDVTSCVAAHLDAFTLNPPLGEDVTVEIPWALP